MSSRKPNILLIFVDNQPARDFSSKHIWSKPHKQSAKELQEITGKSEEHKIGVDAFLKKERPDFL